MHIGVKLIDHSLLFLLAHHFLFQFPSDPADPLLNLVKLFRVLLQFLIAHVHGNEHELIINLIDLSRKFYQFFLVSVHFLIAFFDQAPVVRHFLILLFGRPFSHCIRQNHDLVHQLLFQFFDFLCLRSQFGLPS